VSLFSHFPNVPEPDVPAAAEPAALVGAALVGAAPVVAGLVASRTRTSSWSVVNTKRVGELTKLGLADGDGISLDLEVSDGLGPAQVDAWAAQVLAGLCRIVVDATDNFGPVPRGGKLERFKADRAETKLGNLNPVGAVHFSFASADADAIEKRCCRSGSGDSSQLRAVTCDPKMKPSL